MRQSLLSESNESKLDRITAGIDNVLFHYVQLNMTEGILICPTENQLTSSTAISVLNNFRKTSQHIHQIFQNTLRFKV